jgi:restriction system protein
MQLFFILVSAAFALGLPVILNVANTAADRMYAIAVLLALAATLGAATVAFLRRPNRPFSTDSAPAPAAAAPVRSVEYSLDTRAWSLPLLKRLDWRRFEELCAAYFEMQESRPMILQCRTWSGSAIGIKQVRELHGAMTAGNVAEGTLITSGQFTREAKDFAAKQNIDLVSGAELLKNIAALVPEKAAALLKLATQGDFATPTCPACSVKMVSRMSTEGGRKFWGCRNYPRCKQTFFSTHNAPA